MGIVTYQGLIYIVGGCTHSRRHMQVHIYFSKMWSAFFVRSKLFVKLDWLINAVNYWKDCKFVLIIVNQFRVFLYIIWFYVDVNIQRNSTGVSCVILLINPKSVHFLNDLSLYALNAHLIKLTISQINLFKSKLLFNKENN